MTWAQLKYILSLLESADKSEIASGTAWASVAIFLIVTLFGRNFGLALLPIYDKVLLVKFFAVLAVVVVIVLNGHEIPIVLTILLAWVTLNLTVLVWWGIVGRRLQ